MGLLEDYLLNTRERINDAINQFLNGPARRSLVELIDRKAWEVVYSYHATPEAAVRRRYEIGDKDALSAFVAGHELTITNHTILQGGDGYETDIVQQGYRSYRQPGPRPFMEEALREYIESGGADRDLAAALSDAGIDSKVTGE